MEPRKPIGSSPLIGTQTEKRILIKQSTAPQKIMKLKSNEGNKFKLRL